MKNATTRRGLLILGSVIILTLVFGAGFVAGRWSMRLTPAMDPSRLITGGHGAIGIIQTIDDPIITLQSRDGLVQVRVENNTLIERATRKSIAMTDLRVGDRVAIVGTPNAEGQIVAKLISQLAPNPMRTPGVTRTPNSTK